MSDAPCTSNKITPTAERVHNLSEMLGCVSFHKHNIRLASVMNGCAKVCEKRWKRSPAFTVLCQRHVEVFALRSVHLWLRSGPSGMVACVKQNDWENARKDLFLKRNEGMR